MSTSACTRTLGWRCAVCGTTVDVATPYAFACPNATPTDRHHVLHPLTTADTETDGNFTASDNPFERFGPRMGWWAFAGAHGMSEENRLALVAEVAADFRTTPFEVHHIDGVGPVWVKDETGNVGGSHKARHLAGILLHLRAAELLNLASVDRRDFLTGNSRSPLAIASCGNAAIAAATLAQRCEWPLDVFVPDWASATVLATLDALGATVNVCPRRHDDPPGDPAVLRFREAVANGSIPFSVQGPENGLCLDGGRTIGWELAAAIATNAGTGPERLDRVLVQVGGGAFAACVGWGLGPEVRIDTVQTAGCAPLERAWQRAGQLAVPVSEAATRWGELMTPWHLPHSLADGILDDETYDWLGDFEVMAASGGRPLVADEADVERAADLGSATGVPVSPTGTAGLAGLLTEAGRRGDDETVAVIFSGIAR